MIALLEFLIGLLAVASGMSIENENRIRAAMENPDLFEGDIVGMEVDKDRAGIVDLTQLWPQGIIPFVIDKSLASDSSLIFEAMLIIHSQTCIRFVPKTADDANFVTIASQKGCSSAVGMQPKAQEISLAPECMNKPMIEHQIAHTIGLFHEHSRSDRDEYLTIYWYNIKDDMKPALEKLKLWDNNYLGEDFDYDSVMMLDNFAYAKSHNLKSMVAKTGQTLIPIWAKPGLSDADIRQINRLYECFNETRPLPFLPTYWECDFKTDDCSVNYEGSNTKWKYGVIVKGEKYTKGLMIEGNSDGTAGFKIQSSVIKETKTEGCAYISVYLNGNGNVSLEFYANKGFTNETKFVLSEKTDKWKDLQIKISFPNTYPTFHVLGSTSSSLDVIAIDHIKISLNPCGI